MADGATNKPKDKPYAGTAITITYNARRCIHAAYCVDHLNAVFDPQKHPWIDATSASKEEISEVIHHCPSGALHYIRPDGATEPVPTENTVTLWDNGPLQLSGNLEIAGTPETRATLCRCGDSKNKPFCDNSHRASGFVTTDPTRPESVPLAVTGGPLKVTPLPNGPLKVDGTCTILNAAHEVIFSGKPGPLCRCGHSNSKPFCDGTHTTIEFKAE